MADNRVLIAKVDQCRFGLQTIDDKGGAGASAQADHMSVQQLVSH